MQPLLFKCLHCGTGVRPGGTICSSNTCHEKELARQTKMKERQLGIPFQPDLYELPVHINPG